MIDRTWYTRPEGVPESVSAGGIVARAAKTGILLALARERAYRDNVLPKGHVESGESIEQAARREIAEEVGVDDLSLLCSLGTRQRLDFRKTEWKVTHYFLFLTAQEVAIPRHTEQHTEMVWVPLDPLPSLFWPEQRELVEQNRALIVECVMAATARGGDRL